MKIAVINFSGNVGKTTVARHLLAPRVGGSGARVIAVESINADAKEDAALRGRQFKLVQQEMSMEESVVVDVGASNVEDFVALMATYEGSHEDFDLFVVPVIPTTKQQQD